MNGSSLDQATNAALTIANLNLANDGDYTVAVSDDFNTLVSDPARLVVLIDPLFVTQPKSQSVTAGSDVTFSVAVSGNPPPFGFRWRRNGVTLTNIVLTETNCTFTLRNVPASQAGNYTVIATNLASLTGALSTTAVLTVLPAPPTPPRLTATRNGDQITLSLAGQTGVNYQIQESTNLPNWQSAGLTVTPTAANRVITFPAPNVTTSGVRFYRAVVP